MNSAVSRRRILLTDSPKSQNQRSDYGADQAHDPAARPRKYADTPQTTNCREGSRRGRARTPEKASFRSREGRRSGRKRAVEEGRREQDQDADDQQPQR